MPIKAPPPLKKDQIPFAVYTKEKSRTSHPFFIIWGKSEKSVAYNFFRKYHVSVIKIHRVRFDAINGKWVPATD